MIPVVKVEQLTKVYELDATQRVPALEDVDLAIEPGEFVAVMGHSGSGKSTFMHLVGLLDQPTHGRYYFEGTNVSQFTPDERADIRNRRLGFVFQAYNLLPRTSALENIELPLLYGAVPQAERRRVSLAKLNIVGLADLRHHHPNQMSGGQQQRVAIARALVNEPALILADEPTGALDTKTSVDVMRLFQRLNKEQGITILLVTHEPEVAAWARRIVTFRDGQVISDVRSDQTPPSPAYAQPNGLTAGSVG